VEEQDYVIIETLSSPKLVSSKARPQMMKEYHLTIDMAKELSMAALIFPAGCCDDIAAISKALEDDLKPEATQ
jgi:hypothetical protein